MAKERAKRSKSGTKRGGTGVEDRPRAVRKTRRKIREDGNDGDTEEEVVETKRKAGRAGRRMSKGLRRSRVSSGTEVENDGGAESVDSGRKMRGRLRRRDKSKKGTRKYNKDHSPRDVPDHIVPLQDTFVPAKNKGYGCNYCKFYQYVEGADMSFWQGGKATPLYDSNGAEVTCKTHCMDGVGPKNADIMFIGEAPGADEDDAGEPFVGVAGRLLNRCLKKVGIDRDKVFITNTVRCRPPNNATPSFPNCKACSAYLSEEIRTVKPKIIVALGKVPLQAVMGSTNAKITEAHGNPLNYTIAGHDCILFPMWHPAYVLRNDHLSEEYVQAFMKLAELSQGDVEVQDDDGVYHVLTDANECVKILESMTDTDKITAFDLETSALKPFPDSQRIACISISDDPQVGYAIPLFFGEHMNWVQQVEHLELGWSVEAWQEVVEATRKFLESTTPKIGHNVKFDMNWCEHILGVRPNEVIADTLLMHYATDENSGHGLKALAMKYTNMGPYDDGLTPHLKKTKKRFDLVPWDVLGLYAAMDAVATLRIYDVMCDEIEKQGYDVERVACDVLTRGMLALQRMEVRGAHIDVEFSRKLHADMGTEIDAYKDKIESDPTVRRFCRDMEEEKGNKFKFSIGSSKQMATLFFDKKYLGYPPLAHKISEKTGDPSTDKEVMQYFVDHYDCKLAKLKTDMGLLTKLQNTYVENMMTEAMASDGYIHGSFKPNGTVTGRLASSDPNLQNVPNKGAGAVKRMFDSRFGNEGCLLQADYSQIELRILASLSQDRNMLTVYRNGEDIHLNTTLNLFNMTKKSYEKMEKNDPYEAKNRRTIAKRVNFGIAYGIGAQGIVNTLRKEGVLITEDEARSYIDGFMEAYPGVKEWLDNTHSELKDNGFVKSVYGRYRRLPAAFSDDDEAVARACRQGPNDLIQSPASDTTFTALMLIDEILLANEMESQIIITVHDSIILDCKREEVAEVAKIVKEVMENIPEYGKDVWGEDLDFDFLERVPIVADVEVGINWRDVVGVKDIDNISDALMKSELKASEAEAA